ncbi:MAG: restriction endonuclease subunit S [Ruminococcus sp.]|nr:restriction endonuclease subunit S [Ruminococcus sp.]
MKSETKKRIDQLNNGEIPKGYKKTDFGVFPSDWVTDKKLIDIGTFGKGKGIPGNKMQSDGVPCVGYGDIYMKYNHFHFEEAQSFVDEETAKDSQLIKKGTLLFTGTGETAEEIGKCICYNGYSTICAGGDIITFVPQDVNPLFLAYQQYQNFSLKKKASFGQGHSVVHIQKKSLEKLNVAYPESKNEQSRIVEILMKWDKAIELYDKQIDALTRYKAVCLKKMFPIKGQSVPEWRFQGFSGDWEQRKAKELCNIGTGKSNTQDQVEDGIYPFYIRSDIPVKSNKYLYDCEAVITIGDGNIGRVFHYVNGKFDLHQRCYKMTDFQDIWGKYFYYFFSTRFYDRAMKMTAKATVDSVRLEMISEMDIWKPTAIDEQKKIAEFFASLDNLITLHQRKKEVITNQRKTLQQYLLNGIIRV